MYSLTKSFADLLLGFLFHREIRRNEIAKKYNKEYDSIKDIPQPNDSNRLAKNAQEIAHRRNAEFLQVSLL